MTKAGIFFEGNNLMMYLTERQRHHSLPSFVLNPEAGALIEIICRLLTLVGQSNHFAGFSKRLLIQTLKTLQGYILI